MLSIAELEEMTAVAEDSMFDECVILSYSETMNDIGEALPTYTEGDALPCGLRYQSDQRLERQLPDGTAFEIDATLRLPKGTAVDTRDRIKVVTRYFVAVADPETFAVVGFPQHGPTATVVRLRKVEE